jgi:hypothetical protein
VCTYTPAVDVEQAREQWQVEHRTICVLQPRGVDVKVKLVRRDRKRELVGRDLCVAPVLYATIAYSGERICLSSQSIDLPCVWVF